MANEQRSEKIEAWLKGELPADEAAAFQAEIETDPALAEEVELHRLTLQAMDHLSEQHLQQNVLHWMDGVDIVQKPGPSPWRNRFFITLTLLLLSAAFLWYQIRDSGAAKQNMTALEADIRQRDSVLFEWKQRPAVNPALIDSLSRENELLRRQLRDTTEKPDNPSGPFAYYSKPNDLGLAVRGTENPAVNQFLKEGAGFFQQSRMKQAESKAREALMLEADNREALRLLAHALFGQRRFLEAGIEFEKLQNMYAQSSLEAEEAEWNRMLCYRALSVDAGQRARFIAALNAMLRNPTHQYYTRAKRMEAEMREN